MLLHKGILVVFPQLHDGRHVELIEGGQHCIGVLRILKPACDLHPHPVHLHSVLTPGASNLCSWISGGHSQHWSSSSCRGFGWHWWWWWSCCQGCCWTRWGRWWGCGNRSSSCSSRGGRWRGRRRWSRCCWSRSCWGWSCSWFGSTRAKLYLEKLNPRLNCGSILNQKFCDNSRTGGGHRHRGLVSLNFAENLILCAVTYRLLPSDVAFRNGIGKSRTHHHFHLLPQNSGGEDTPSDHWVLVKQRSSGQDGGTRGLGRLSGKHREVPSIASLVEPPQDPPGAYPARP